MAKGWRIALQYLCVLFGLLFIPGVSLSSAILAAAVVVLVLQPRRSAYQHKFQPEQIRQRILEAGGIIAYINKR